MEKRALNRRSFLYHRRLHERGDTGIVIRKIR